MAAGRKPVRRRRGLTDDHGSGGLHPAWLAGLAIGGQSALLPAALADVFIDRLLNVVGGERTGCKFDLGC